jgi:hypothetical protein
LTIFVGASYGLQSPDNSVQVANANGRGLAPVLVGMAILIIGAVGAQAAPPSDQNHFRCYIVSQQTPQAGQTITLEDQFNEGDPQTVIVGEPVMICTPTEKTVGEDVSEIEDENEHFVLYNAPDEAEPRIVLVTNQFGTDVSWMVTTPTYILVPTAKTVDGQTFDDRDDLQHYWCYEANGPRSGVRAKLHDQFSGPDNVRITTPTLFCNPAEKVANGEKFPILDEDLHLACYEIHGKQKTQQFTVGVENQFEKDIYQTAAWEILCAPSEKNLPE